jgi:ankyrin repeat protein
LLITADIHGRTPLHIAITRKHYKIIEEILKLQKEVSGNSKTLFAQFINYPNELTDFTPFIKASYISENTKASKALLQLFLSRAKEVFGLNNAWFNRFINHRDLNGYTALSYVSVPELRDLLIKYGARDPLDPKYPPHLFKKQVLNDK